MIGLRYPVACCGIVHFLPSLKERTTANRDMHQWPACAVVRISARKGRADEREVGFFDIVGTPTRKRNKRSLSDVLLRVIA